MPLGGACILRWWSVVSTTPATGNSVKKARFTVRLSREKSYTSAVRICQDEKNGGRDERNPRVFVRVLRNNDK